jgi:hypothetical protein
VNGIGVIGIGISGLQLALYLQRHGVQTSLYSPYPMAEVVAGPLRCTPTRWAATLERERCLGLVDLPARPVSGMRVTIKAAGIDVMGTIESPGDNTDFRIYLPWLLEAYLARGGDLRVSACGRRELAGLAGRHELVVVAGGRDFGGIFPVDPGRSPHRIPPRCWTIGFFEGIDLVEGVDIEIGVVPGVGEFFHNRFASFTGPVSLVGICALPEGPLGELHRHCHTDDPTGFTAAFLTALRTFAPGVHARIEESRFAPARPLDVLQGAFVPCVRRAWASVEGRPVMALGDAWLLNDPIVAQGANVGSRSAFALGAAIVEHTITGAPYDEAFCRHGEAAMWEQAQAPTALSNAFLAPPPPSMLELFARAGREPALADRIVSGFGNAEAMLAMLAPETAAL